MLKQKTLTILFLLGLLTCAALANQEEITVRFKAGTSSASYKGSVTEAGVKGRGEQHDMYTLGASANQVMKVEVTSDVPAYVYIWKDSFNTGFILDAKGRNIETRFQLPSNGDYKVNIAPADYRQDMHYDVKFTITH